MNDLPTFWKNARGLGYAISGVCIALAVLLYSSGALVPLERMTYDLRFQLRGPRPPMNELILVTMDEKSVGELNRKISQWPRTYLAKVIDNLGLAGTELIVVDLDLSKPGFSLKGEDEALARAMDVANNVVLARYTSQGRKVLPFRLFRDVEIGEGFVDHLPDTDGILRGSALVSLEVDEDTAALTPYFSMPLEIARLYLYPFETPAVDLSMPDIFRMGKISIPYPDGKMAIDYTGPSGSFEKISFSDVYNGNFEQPLFAGKIVIIGNIHPAYHDYFLTPSRKTASPTPGFEVKGVIGNIGAGIPGVEVIANAVATILQKSYITRPGMTVDILSIIVLGSILSIIFIILNIRPLYAFGVFLALFSAIPATAHLLFLRSGQMIQIIPLEVTLSGIFVAGVSYHRILGAIEKAQIKKTFGHYVSHQVVEKLLDNPDLVRLGGEKKEMTVLFSDARNFTAISEMMDPVDLVKFLNEYHTEMTRAVFNNDGVLDKYIGDAIMAFYGAPIDQEDHARRACRTALEMSHAHDALTARWQEEGLPFFDMGIGINTGPMVVGNMGSEMRFDYTVLGDSVNLGSRLESANKEYGTRIIVSEYTREMSGDEFAFRELDLVRLKGKVNPVRIFELLSDDMKNNREAFDLFEEGVSAYRKKEWAEAVKLFEKVLARKEGDGPAEMYVDRCRRLENTTLPSDWDGVYTMVTK